MIYNILYSSFQYHFLHFSITQPIQESARTSILCWGLRYSWTKIPKLVFNKDTTKVSFDGYNEMYTNPLELTKLVLSQWRHKHLNAINQVLLMHLGPVHEFIFSFDADDTCVEIDQIIFQLSRNGNNVKKFSIDLKFGCCWYKLPLSLFSLHQLTELNLYRCCLFHQPTFDGFKSFNSLTSLCRRWVIKYSQT